jgi:hypothetical protein
MVGRRLAICILLLACVVGPQMQPSLTAQAATSWNFDTGLQGWTVTGLWAADATPATVNPAPPPGITSASFVSPSASLNYNDGTDFDTGVANSGTATSPTITITAPDNFGWQCNHETENIDDGSSAGEMTSFDRRLVRVRSGGTVVFEIQLTPVGGTVPPTWSPGPANGTQACTQMGEWHTHVISLDPAWSPLTIEFFFDSIDGVLNLHSGWFVDDAALGSSGGGGGGPGGSGPGGASRDNANGNSSLNDLFGENWCGGGSATTTWSGLGLIAALAVLATLVVGRR